MTTDDLKQRVHSLEERVAQLEMASPGPHAVETDRAVGLVTPVQVDRKRTLVGLSLTGKRLLPGRLQSHVDFNFMLTLAADSKPTRAIKGTLAFCDLFGEPKCEVTYTYSGQLVPGVPCSVSGIQFVYNQFMAPHQWIVGTELADVVAYFEVSQAIFDDGTSVSF